MVRLPTMGMFHFDVPDSVREFFHRSLWKDAYVCGIEGVPWQSQTTFENGRLSVRRAIDASGKLYLACPVEGLGFRTLSTCSLRVTETPYQLALELARGSCHRARVQADVWRRAGLTVRPQFDTLLDEGTEQFLDAAKGGGGGDDEAVAAVRAIGTLERAIGELGECFAMQSLAFRRQREHQIGTLLAGGVVPPAPADSVAADTFRETFNAAAVRTNWSQIETDSGRFDYDAARRSVRWCADHGLRVIAGPLLDFRSRMIPNWLYLMEDDFESFLGAVTQFAERTVLEFRGSVQLWNAAAGLNTPGPLSLDDEQLMRLAVCVLQAIRRCDPNTPAVLMFDQPFGEYLAKHRDGISPIHFADALARSGIGMAGVGLDVRFHYADNATLPRSAVDFGEMVDRWATLGLPMLVQLGAAGGRGPDPHAILPSETLPPPETECDAAAEQCRVAGPILKTLLAKHSVHGVVWDGWSDAEPHLMSHSGLIDANGKRRPLLKLMTRLRRDFLA